MELRFKKTDQRAKIPTKATEGSSGYDLVSLTTCTLFVGKHRAISTGVSLELPEGYEAQVRPRSGLAAKHGITVLNSPGTIDNDYRGEIKVLLVNHGDEPVLIEEGMRIAQLVPSKLAGFEAPVEVEEVSETERGDGGFGSTGV